VADISFENLPAFEVAMGSDGMPSDPVLRRIAVSIKSLLGPHKGHELQLIASLSRKGKAGRGPLAKFDLDKAAKVKSVIAAMVGAGSLVSDGHADRGHRRIGVAPRADGATKQEIKENGYRAIARGVGSRVCSTPAGQERATSLFLMLRSVYGFHAVRFGNGRAMLVPTGIDMALHGPVASSAIVVAPESRGITFYQAEADAIRTRYGDDRKAAFDVDPARLRPLPEEGWDYRQIKVSPYASAVNNNRAETILAERASEALKAFRSQREQAQAWVGEELSDQAWKSFMTSLSRVKKLEAWFRRMLFTVLDPEVRKACLRMPEATYETYEWFCASDDVTRERRLQASAAYPLLTPMLKSFRLVIDQGEPLAPALAAKFGVSQSVIRRLVGVNWQKVGDEFRSFRQWDTAAPILQMADALGPQAFPSSRKEWDEVAHMGRSVSQMLAFPLPPELLPAVRKREQFARLMKQGLKDAVSDTANMLRNAVEGRWVSKVGGYEDFLDILAHDEADEGNGPFSDLHRLNPEVSRRTFDRLIAAITCGEHGSVKRLDAFNDAWHRGAPRRLASVKRLYRLSGNLETNTWLPMTPEPYEHKGGTLTWLVNEDELAVEGEEMRHCVGGYTEHCYIGKSHIAAVRGAKGGRSTVEFWIDNGKVVLVQNQGRGNVEPPQDCVSVVKAFLKTANGRKSPVDIQRHLEAGETRRHKRREETRKAREISPEIAESLLRLYDECLPKGYRGLSVAQWREMLGMPAEDGGEEIAGRIHQPGESALANPAEPAVRDNQGFAARMARMLWAERAA